MTALQFLTEPRFSNRPILAEAEAAPLLNVTGDYYGALFAEPHEFFEMSHDRELELKGAILYPSEEVKTVFWLKRFA